MRTFPSYTVPIRWPKQTSCTTNKISEYDTWLNHRRRDFLALLKCIFSYASHGRHKSIGTRSLYWDKQYYILVIFSEIGKIHTSAQVHSTSKRQNIRFTPWGYNTMPRRWMHIVVNIRKWCVNFSPVLFWSYGVLLLYVGWDSHDPPPTARARMRRGKSMLTRSVMLRRRMYWEHEPICWGRGTNLPRCVSYTHTWHAGNLRQFSWKAGVKMRDNLYTKSPSKVRQSIRWMTCSLFCLGSNLKFRVEDIWTNVRHKTHYLDMCLSISLKLVAQNGLGENYRVCLPLKSSWIMC